VLGPGSWFTSVLPHLLVPDLAQALTTTVAHRILVLNLVPQPGETAGFSPEQHLTVLRDHAPSGLRCKRSSPMPIPWPCPLGCTAAQRCSVGTRTLTGLPTTVLPIATIR
jgi:hypothetical protein